jgi:mono/diheme cytochrome c family protein
MNKNTLIVLLCLVWTLSRCQKNPYQEGGRLYSVHCANCHGEDGKGLGTLIPPLAGADYLSAQRLRLPCIVVNGLSDTIKVNGVVYGGQPMPANSLLTDIQVTNVLNYINNSWGNNLPDFTLQEVRGMLPCGGSNN